MGNEIEIPESKIKSFYTSTDNFHLKHESGERLPLCPVVQNEHEKCNNLLLPNLTKRQKYSVSVNAVAVFLVSVVMAAPIPFYTQEAEIKGMSVTLIGLFFGICPITSFLTTPFVGSHLPQIGPKFVYISSLFIISGSTIIFAFVIYSPNGTPFIVINLLARLVLGLGQSAFITTSFAVLSSELPHSMSLAFGLLEGASGVGYTVGPLMSGVLYEQGGFYLPFMVMGSSIIFVIILALLFLPTPVLSGQTHKGSVLCLLKSPLVFVAMIGLFIMFLVIKEYDITIYTIMEQFHLSEALNGAIYSIVPITISISCPAMGYLVDKNNNSLQYPIILVFFIVYGVSLLFIGPSTFFSPFINPSITMLCSVFVFFGVSFGVLDVCLYKCVTQGTLDMGYENSLETMALCSGLFNSVINLGGFIGPVLIGSVIERFGMQLAYSVLGTICLLHPLILSCYLITKLCFVRRGK